MNGPPIETPPGPWHDLADVDAETARVVVDAFMALLARGDERAVAALRRAGYGSTAPPDGWRTLASVPANPHLLSRAAEYEREGYEWTLHYDRERVAVVLLEAKAVSAQAACRLCGADRTKGVDAHLRAKAKGHKGRVPVCGRCKATPRPRTTPRHRPTPPAWARRTPEA